MGIPPVVDPGLEAFAIISFVASQPLEGAGLRVLYLVETVFCQLMGVDTPQVSMDPPPFVLALLSITDAEYQLWRNGIPYAQQLVDDLDSCLPFLLKYVSSLFHLSFLFTLHILHVMIFKCGDHVRMWVVLLTLLTCLGRSIPMALMTSLRSVLWDVT